MGSDIGKAKYVYTNIWIENNICMFKKLEFIFDTFKYIFLKIYYFLKGSFVIFNF